jgi:PPM family protein phosphatase
MRMMDAPLVTVDAYGLTDRGKVRPDNEDHFLVAYIHKSVDLLWGSLSADALQHRLGTAAAQLLVVADGVGGGPDGDVASERTTAAVLTYAGKTAGCFHGLDVDREHYLLSALEKAVEEVHHQLIESGDSHGKAPATTLTLVLLVWPRAYVVHVGDSRAYVRRRGRVQALTRDQTLGEYMIAAGAWSEAQAAQASTSDALTSAVGGAELTPSVGLVDLEPGDSLLLCTDGLTNQVPLERIEQVLALPIDAKGMAELLVKDALAAGGADNVSVIVARGVA